MGAFVSGMKFGVYVAGAIIGFQIVYVPIRGIAKGLAKIWKEEKETDEAK